MLAVRNVFVCIDAIMNTNNQSTSLSSRVGRPLLPRRPLVRLGLGNTRPSAVLAPVDVKTAKKSIESTKHQQPGQSRGLAGVLLSMARIWGQPKASPTKEELMQRSHVLEVSNSVCLECGRKPTPLISQIAYIDYQHAD